MYTLYIYMDIMSCAAKAQWPVGLTDKASASGAGDSRFEPWAGHCGFARYTEILDVSQR